MYTIGILSCGVRATVACIRWYCISEHNFEFNSKLCMQAMLKYIIYVCRASTLRHDGGDIAFPGGMKDLGDIDEAATCLREAEEEIGLQKHQVMILAQLLPRINRRQILITPLIGLVQSSFTPSVNPSEVEEAFCLPLERFLSKHNYSSSSYDFYGIMWYIHFFTDTINEKTFVTWGLTATMCVETAIAVLKRVPEFKWDSTGLNSIQNPYAVQTKFIRKFVNEITDMPIKNKL